MTVFSKVLDCDFLVVNLHEYEIGGISRCKVAGMRGKDTYWFNKGIKTMLLQHEIMSLAEKLLDLLIFIGVHNASLS